MEGREVGWDQRRESEPCERHGEVSEGAFYSPTQVRGTQGSVANLERCGSRFWTTAITVTEGGGGTGVRKLTQSLAAGANGQMVRQAKCGIWGNCSTRCAPLRTEVVPGGLKW